MELNKLTTRTIPADIYKSVVIVGGALIVAECNGAQKHDHANEIAKRCNAYPLLLAALENFITTMEALPASDETHLRVWDIYITKPAAS